MAQFLNLPRELRDMIYMNILTAQCPRPTLGEAQWLFKFRRAFEPGYALRGEYGCAYSVEKAPATCANFLCCSRQVFVEMTEAIRLARRKELLAVRLDCIAEDESFHYFTWLGIPLVRTTAAVAQTNSGADAAERGRLIRLIPGWADGIMKRYLGCPHRAPSGTCLVCRDSTTLIQRLWVDIRIHGDRSGKWFRNTEPQDRTSWALCAALKRMLEKGPAFFGMEKGKVVMVEELVLNVVSTPNVSKERYLEEDFPLDGVHDGIVNPRTVAKELVEVWNRIWAGDDYKSGFYQVLLERIARVRVCVDEETWRVRELRLELERGRAERRRIAARVGW